MNAEIHCQHCGKVFIPNPRNKNQTCCSKKACQRVRKSNWHRNKMRYDADYRLNQKDAQEAWRKNNPGYWDAYRKKRDDYCRRNRQLQKARDKKGG